MAYTAFSVLLSELWCIPDTWRLYILISCQVLPVTAFSRLSHGFLIASDVLIAIATWCFLSGSSVLKGMISRAWLVLKIVNSSLYSLCTTRQFIGVRSEFMTGFLVVTSLLNCDQVSRFALCITRQFLSEIYSQSRRWGPEGGIPRGTMPLFSFSVRVTACMVVSVWSDSVSCTGMMIHTSVSCCLLQAMYGRSDRLVPNR